MLPGQVQGVLRLGVPERSSRHCPGQTRVEEGPGGGHPHILGRKSPHSLGRPSMRDGTEGFGGRAAAAAGGSEGEGWTGRSTEVPGQNCQLPRNFSLAPSG